MKFQAGIVSSEIHLWPFPVRILRCQDVKIVYFPVFIKVLYGIEWKTYCFLFSITSRNTKNSYLCYAACVIYSWFYLVTSPLYCLLKRILILKTLPSGKNRAFPSPSKDNVAFLPQWLYKSHFFEKISAPMYLPIAVIYRIHLEMTYHPNPYVG